MKNVSMWGGEVGGSRNNSLQGKIRAEIELNVICGVTYMEYINSAVTMVMYIV